MAKSWKKVIKSDTPDSQKNSGESASLDSVQLTLDEITAQNEELAELMKERQVLENEMNALLQAQKRETTDSRFSGSIESFQTKKQQENQRSIHKKLLEQRISRKNNELKEWSEKNKRLKEKMAFQKRVLSKKKAEKKQELKRPDKPEKQKTTPRDTTKKWGDVNFTRKAKPVSQEKTRKKKAPETLFFDKPKKSSESVKEKQRPLPDSFELKDIQNLKERFNLDSRIKLPSLPGKERHESVLPEKAERTKPEKERQKEKSPVAEALKSFSEFNRPATTKKKEPIKELVRLPSVRDKWEEKRNAKRDELKEKIGLQKLSDKLSEIKRFATLPGMDKGEKSAIPEFKTPEIQDLEKPFSFEEKQDKIAENSSLKKQEKKEDERREKLKEDARVKRKAEKQQEEREQLRKERKKEKYS